MKTIVLCADDYGQDLEISQGIINLIKHKRLSAVSCLVTGPEWASAAIELTAFKSQVDIGLHFNLTEGQALSQEFIAKYGQNFYSLKQLLQKSYSAQLDLPTVKAELLAQIENFVSRLGFLPDYIDGHQHIHQFPIIRQALLQVYQQKLMAKKSYIRVIQQKIKLTDVIFNYKKIVIHLFGAAALKNLLQQHDIPHNQSFSGIYDFKSAKNYHKIFPGFLREIQDGGIIMCHPGLASSRDVINKARCAEYEYFLSQQFLLDCQAASVRIERMSAKRLLSPLSLA